MPNFTTTDLENLSKAEKIVEELGAKYTVLLNELKTAKKNAVTDATLDKLIVLTYLDVIIKILQVGDDKEVAKLVDLITGCWV